MQSLLTMQFDITNMDFVDTTATLVTATICFHNSALFSFILNETFDMLQQQETVLLHNVMGYSRQAQSVR